LAPICGRQRAVQIWPRHLPHHKDNQTIIKERIYIDKSNPDLLYDEITTIDNALTCPSCRHWQGKLFSQCRRLLDAVKEGPATTGSGIFS
jgi:hypothetical protein